MNQTSIVLAARDPACGRKDMHCAVAVNVALVPGGSRMNRIRACNAVRRARTVRFSRSCLAAGLDPGGFPRASTSYVCGAAAIPPCAANCRQPDAACESRSCHRSGQPVRLTRCRPPRRSPISRSLARVDAKKRPSNLTLSGVCASGTHPYPPPAVAIQQGDRSSRAPGAATQCWQAVVGSNTNRTKAATSHEGCYFVA
jgi:hypothetical protein